MNRRQLLAWTSRLIALAGAAVVAVPGVRFLAAPLLAKRSDDGPVRRRLCRLDELTPGTPKLISIVGNRQDAWTEFPQETIGRVWVVRRTDADTPPKETKLDVYSAVCPHLGCTIQLDDDGESFVCPCHMAFFDLSGETYSAEQLARRLDRNDDVKNPAPRDMDPLESEASNLVQDKATGQWWVEVAYQRFQAGIAERIPVT